MSAEPSPAPHIISAWREAAGLDRAQAAALVYVAPDTWFRWEAGTRKMPLSAFELFCLKAERATK